MPEPVRAVLIDPADVDVNVAFKVAYADEGQLLVNLSHGDESWQLVLSHAAALYFAERLIEAVRRGSGPIAT